MAQRMTFLFSLTTNPADRSSASPHSAGWSESWWTKEHIFLSGRVIPRLASCRARLLPANASIIGFRLANYTISGNRLKPTGSSTGKLQYMGLPGTNVDLPQVAVEMTGSARGAANQSRFSLRGVHDSIMVNGEYQPDPDFKRNMTLFCNQLTSDDWGFIGRDLTVPSANVLNVVAGVITLDGALGLAVGDYLRFHRVKDDDGKPIQGAYRVTALANGGLTVTVANLAQIVTTANGTARWDKIDLYEFAAVAPARAVVRKVGRPFEVYRGRRSKR